MALDPTYDPYADDPYFAWARQQQLAQLQAPDPLMFAADGGHKGGQPTGGGPGHDQIAQAVIAPPQELPAGVLPPKPVDEPEKPDQPEEPDAISGAGEIPVSVTSVEPTTQPDAPSPTSIDYPTWAAQHAAQQPLPSMQENDAMASAKAEQQAIANMSPEQYIQWQGERAGKLRDMQLQRQTDIEAENRRRTEENLRLQQQAYATAQAKTADLMAQAHALSQTKVVAPKPTMANALGIILGGLFSNGGPNMALAQFNRKVDNDIAAQHANIQNQFRGLEMQKTAIGDEYARSGDLYHAQEVYRVAAYEQALQQMQTELQKYDPAGATAALIRDGMDKFHAAQVSAIQDYNKNQTDLELKKAQTLQALASAQKTRQETIGLAAKQAGAGAAPAAQVLPREYFQRLGLAVPPEPMSADAYKEWLDLSKKGAEFTGAQSDAATKVKAQTVTESDNTVRNPVTGDALTDEKGQPILSAKATDINRKTTAAQKYVDAMSDVRAALAADPSTIDRKRWSAIQAKVEQAKVAMIDYFGAKPSSREMQVADEVVGADFKSYVSRIKDKGVAISAMDTLIDGVKRDQQTELKGTVGYKGESPLLDTSRPAPAAPIPSDEALKQIGEVGSGKLGVAGDLNSEVDKIGRDTPEGRRAIALTIPPSKLAVLDRLYDQAQGGDKDALAALQTIADGKTPNTYKQLRSYAGQLVAGALGSNISLPEAP